MYVCVVTDSIRIASDFSYHARTLNVSISFLFLSDWQTDAKYAYPRCKYDALQRSTDGGPAGFCFLRYLRN